MILAASSWRLGAVLVLGLSSLMSLVVLGRPMLAMGVAAGTTGLVAVLVVVRNPPRLFLGLLGGLLIGYALFGWRFASLGVSPVFVGEVVLAIGVVATLRLQRPLSVFDAPVVWLIALYIVWGALRTFPYLEQYQVNALRDGVLWGYALFALMVAGALRETNLASAVVSQYARWLPVFLIWAPIALIIVRFTEAGPSSVFWRIMKGNDAGTHLAGVATFLLLGLHRTDGTTRRPMPLIGEWALWALGMIAFALVAVTTRGGLLAIAGPLLLVLLVRPGRVGTRLGLVGAGFLFIVLLAVALDFSMSGAGERAISPQQMVANFWSIFSSGGAGDAALEGTRRWRLLWWQHIIDYTVHGEYFWGGKGFGINLATSDGFQVYELDALRSPHNVHMTILARAGVPGIVIWALLQLAFVGTLVRGYVRAQRVGADHWARINLWVLAYWLAFMISATFDVFLEGPYAGIWFWSLVGFGIAIQNAQRRDMRHHSRPRGGVIRKGYKGAGDPQTISAGANRTLGTMVEGSSPHT